MSTNVHIPARSVHGCWTCRIRRKKCDEVRPACTPCTSLELDCHGYGSRPVWMDNGPLQKEQASKLKYFVGQVKSRRARQRAHGSLPHSQEGVGGVESTVPSSHPIMNLNSGERNPQYPPDDSSYPLSFFSSPDPSFSSRTWRAMFADGCTTAESAHFFTQESESQSRISAIFNEPGQIQRRGQGILTPESSETATLVSTNIQETGSIWPDIASYLDNGSAARTFSNFEDTNWCSSSSGSSCSYTNADNSYPYLEPSQTLPQLASDINTQQPRYSLASPGPTTGGNEAEDVLFMHYLDHVFFIQYPFYQGRERSRRGWLFSILKRVKPAYYATLALSQRDILSTMPQTSESRSKLKNMRARGSYHHLAAQGVQGLLEGTWNGQNSLSQSLDGLTYLLQLLFWEIFNGATKNWQVLLRSASGLIPPVLQARMSLLVDEGARSPSQNGSESIALLPEVYDASRMLLATFIAFDILHCVSTRLDPYLDVDHVEALNSLGLCAESLLGCRSATLILIFEVSALDRWKRDAKKTRKLSIVELARRGGVLEERLRRELAVLDNHLAFRPAYRSQSQSHRMQAPSEVSKLFTLAAIVYLHVVISGAHPDLPEIVQPVSEAISVFKSMSDPTLLQNVVWPFCVTGCLALEEQKDYFRELFAAAEVTESSKGTCGEAFKIIEQCWWRRKTSSYNCDWALIMEQRDQFVMLI